MKKYLYSIVAATLLFHFLACVNQDSFLAKKVDVKVDLQITGGTLNNYQISLNNENESIYDVNGAGYYLSSSGDTQKKYGFKLETNSFDSLKNQFVKVTFRNGNLGNHKLNDSTFINIRVLDSENKFLKLVSTKGVLDIKSIGSTSAINVGVGCNTDKNGTNTCEGEQANLDMEATFNGTFKDSASNNFYEIKGTIFCQNKY